MRPLEKSMGSPPYPNLAGAPHFYPDRERSAMVRQFEERDTPQVSDALARDGAKLVGGPSGRASHARLILSGGVPGFARRHACEFSKSRIQPRVMNISTCSRS